MDDLLEKTIRDLEACSFMKTPDCAHCTQDGPGFGCACRETVRERALALLKAQKPRLIVDEDFDNPPIANAAGEIPCWMENRKYDEVSPCVLTPCLFGEKHIGERYWTSRPTDEQRKAVKWE